MASSLQLFQEAGIGQTFVATPIDLDWYDQHARPSNPLRELPHNLKRATPARAADSWSFQESAGRLLED